MGTAFQTDAVLDKINGMDMENKRILLFDIDGTLLDMQGEGRRLMCRALRQVFGVAGPSGAYDMSGKTDWQIVVDLMTLAGIEPQIVEAGLRDVFAVYSRLVAHKLSGLQICPLPGVLPLLERLKMLPVFELGLLTGNVREAVPPKLRAAGIDPMIFCFGAFGSENIDRNRLPFLALERLAALRNAPADSNSVLVIGDTPLDIACARHAGMKVLSLATGRYDREALARHHPDFLLDDLADLDAVMAILNRF